MRKIIFGLVIGLLVFGCGTQKNLVEKKPPELKIMIYGSDQMKFLVNFVLYKNYNVEMTHTDDYIVIKNITEEILVEIHKLIRQKTDIMANNIANATTTRTSNGGPYIRQKLIVSVENGVEIIEDTQAPSRLVYDPFHPDAISNGNKKGYVIMPNVDIVTEMVDMISMSRLYEGIMDYSQNYFNNIVW